MNTVNISGQIHLLTGYTDRDQWQNADVALCRKVIERILRAPATEDSWLALLELFSAWPDAEDIRAWVDELEPKIAHWPWTVRQSTLGQQQTRGDKQVVYRLVGHLHIRNIDDSSGLKLARWGQNPHWRNLQGLTLYKVEICAADLARFLSLPGINHLQQLELVALDSLHGDIATLFAEPMPTLTSLKLASLGLNNADLVALQKCSIGPQLTSLDLSSNHLGPRDLDLLLSPDAFAALEWLSVAGTDLDAEAITGALERCQHGRLQKLSFAHTPAARSLSVDWLAAR